MPHTFGNSATDDGVTGSSSSGRGLVGTSAQSEGVHGETNASTSAAVAGIAMNPSGTGAGIFGESRGLSGPGVFGTSAQGEGVHGETSSAHGGAVGVNKGSGAGVFGVSEQGEGVHGETNASTSAAVAGIAMNPSGTGAGIFGESRGNGPAAFFKGNVEIAGDVTILNGKDIRLADFAEDFDISGFDEIEPGSVVVLDDEGSVRPSRAAYDHKVAGVVSGAGNFRSAITLDRQESQGVRRAIALMGKVYCKVDAQYSAIGVGDLLTTSPTPGHAMKAIDPLKAFGAVIGKALRPLRSGQGLIPILVALQ